MNGNPFGPPEGAPSGWPSGILGELPEGSMTFDCDLFLLDLGNVLVKFDHAIIARKLSKLSRQPIFSIVSKFIRSGLGELFDEGKITADEFVSRVIRDLSLKITPEEFKKIWNEMFVESPGMEAIVKEIKKKYPVFVISDTNSLHFNFVSKNFPVMKHVDQFILSYEIGFRKPHPKIFEEALRRAHTTAAKTFFADDRKEIVEAASRMGFRSFHMRDVPSFKKELEHLGFLGVVA